MPNPIFEKPYTTYDGETRNLIHSLQVGDIFSVYNNYLGKSTYLVTDRHLSKLDRNSGVYFVDPVPIYEVVQLLTAYKYEGTLPGGSANKYVLEA